MVKRTDATFGLTGGAASKELRKLRTPIIKAFVTQQIINCAKRANSGYCLLAEAVKAAAPWGSAVSADLQTIRITDREKGLRYFYLTPRVAQVMLIGWDQGIVPKPFPFVLRSGQIRTSYKRAPGGKRLEVHKLGKRRMEFHGNKIPDIIGGETPARGPLSNGRGKEQPIARGGFGYRREFGLRAYVGGFDLSPGEKMPAGGPSLADK